MKISSVPMLLLVSWMLDISECPLTFLSQNNREQQWVFDEGSNATLVCNNSPYTGIHTFKFDSRPVFSCVGTHCLTKENDQDGFSFEYNMDSGVFTWIINFVKMIYNGKVFECEDGSDRAKYSATVQGKSLTFKVHNSQDGQWTFKEGSTVELVCTNNPYSGIHAFTLDTVTVCSCTGSICITKNNDQGGFSFKNNTSSGVFIWTINTVKMAYNGMIFGCEDGSNHVNYTIIVEGDSKERHRSRLFYILYVGGPTCIIMISLCVWRCRKTRNNCSCLTQTCDKSCKQSNMTEMEMVWISPARPDEEQKITMLRTSTKNK